MRNHPGRWGGGYGHPLIGILIMTAVIVGIVLLVVWIVRRTTRHDAVLASGPQPRGGPDAALEHARVRYARGELSRDQYVQIVADLGGFPPGPPGPASPPAQPEGPPASG